MERMIKWYEVQSENCRAFVRTKKNYIDITGVQRIQKNMVTDHG